MGRNDADRTAARDQEIFTKYLFGHTQVELAEEYGLAQSAISRIINKLRESVTLPTREDLVKRSVARLDALLKKAWAVAEAEHLAVSHGRVIYDPRTGEPMKDHAPLLQAIDRIVRLEERVAKLLGLDAADRLESPTGDDLDAELIELVNEAKAKAANAGAQYRQMRRAGGPRAVRLDK